ncbi:MAG: penicillin-binding transpeptidase domain-containing protein [Candidatus Krumholzibacteriia bacterium]
MPRGLRLVRIEQIAALVLGLVLLLTARLFHLQIVRFHAYRQQQIRQVDVRREVPARRGRILDRQGRPLAFDVVAYDVSVLKNRLRRADLPVLSGALGMETARIGAALRAGGRFVPLVHGVTLSAAAVKCLRTLPGVCLDRRSFRKYPYGALAAQYLGFTDAGGRGVEGVEKTFDEVLRGTPGEVVLLRDENGQPIGHRSGRDPVDGMDVVLALDVDLQRIADDELQGAMHATAARGGSVLLLDPHTGDVLACASAPLPDQRGGAYVPDEWRNRAVYDLFEPGSTLKPITAIAALRQGTADLGTYIYAERGAKRFGRAGIIRDAHRGDAWLSFVQAFARSSNICFAKLARSLSSEALYEELRGFGFGCRSGIALIGEPCGQLALPRDWSGRTRLTLGYGQEISVTAVQLAGLYTTIANGGTLMQPRVALELVDSQGGARHELATRPVRRILTHELAVALRWLCRVTVEAGTGRKARIDGLAVAGKTGTAEKAAGGRYVDRYVASFAGFAPVHAPRLVCLVVLDEPRGRHHSGGQSAAPVFRRILEAILRSTTWLEPHPDRVAVVREDELGSGAARMQAPRRLATLDSGALPDLRGLHLRVAARWLRRLGVEPRAEGAGIVRAHWPGPGENVATGDVVRLLCRPDRGPERRASVWPR